jgi:hypothetical protein
MMHDDDFTGSKELLRNYDAAEGVGYSTSRIADDMGITFFEAKGSSGIWLC